MAGVTLMGRMTLRGCLPLLAVALVLALGEKDAQAQAHSKPKCSFRGEIFYSENFDGVLVYRGNVPTAPERARQNLPLYPGDHITIAAERKVQIRDRPSQTTRTLTAADSPFMIAQPESCTTSPGILAMFDIVSPFFDALSSGPVAAEPLSTLPRGDAADQPVTFPFQGQQKIALDTKGFDIRWTGPKSKLTMKRERDGKLLTVAEATDRPYAHIALPEDVKSGERFIVQIQSGRSTAELEVLVAATDDLPKRDTPSFEAMSDEEKVIYALWMGFSGPEEWRMQGYTFITQASKHNYMAWKIWRAMNARKLEH